jgi:hypothetical protein
VSSDERTPEIISGASLKLWRGNQGREAARETCREAPTTCHNPALGAAQEPIGRTLSLKAGPV